ncbi:hypothetical protein A2814_01115 [Candidatus Nomurabacteria bacterium RIFCSPHIGHO2_01_FULL_38_19]|uniref:DoxX family protein n=1 Tax=Candidatus Nomurabacteria bacterium RIFCSPHIGHO2_01_FULL_38_19 TaxID=1801732 RepID=A0A1F6UQD7_9BACT|nr:MAG: hypothetical protein A2814_01115 [Candidatus Nomurabacteria bacterium RIFCSPHIGHO2_01_FULL_38_19]
MDILLLVGRIMFGGYFLMMGMMHFKNLKMMTGYAASKGTPLPSFAVIVSGLMIFMGGLGVIFGQYIQISLALIAIFLLLVTPVMHAFWKETDPNKKMIEMQNFLKNMTMFGASIALLALSFGL